MTTNLRLKNPTCRAHIFKRLLSYVFNQINNFIMVLIETVGQKNKNPRPRGQKWENPRRKETQENEISRLIQNSSEISRLEQKFPRPWIFRIPFATPLTGPISYFKIKFSRWVGCVLTSNEVQFVSLADNFTVQFLNLLKLSSGIENKTR